MTECALQILGNGLSGGGDCVRSPEILRVEIFGPELAAGKGFDKKDGDAGLRASLADGESDLGAPGQRG